MVIPVYQANLNAYEQISLRRAFAILADHPICLLVPRSRQNAIRLMLQKLLPLEANCGWQVVDDHCLDSHRSYNQMMLEPAFYRHYASHSHLLICQLDAYVFEDQLLHWCHQPFDYIGAPLYLPNATHGPAGLFCVGVGGFSLRRIQPILALLQANPIVFRSRELREILQPFNNKARALYLIRYLFCRLINGCRLAAPGNQLSRWVGVNEDAVFAKYLPRYHSSFRLPDASAALEFCIDKHVELELAALGGAIPFAAHAWWTCPENLAAWRPFITELQTSEAI
ncbi:DUF5672 family protein [Synechococcus sp. CS-1324]|uniref:DUF5672 family protein n=1 Tax=Synechococcus sp. CS-1324 TaxID=2847980 RepID=UPI0021E32B8E|nr:DUF5672 family protein [Synechococcus sp. CS-1324]